MAQDAIQPPDMTGVPFEVGLHFALAGASKNMQLTQSLEGLAMRALTQSMEIEDNMLSWLRQWGH